MCLALPATAVLPDRLVITAPVGSPSPRSHCSSSRH